MKTQAINATRITPRAHFRIRFIFIGFRNTGNRSEGDLLEPPPMQSASLSSPVFRPLNKSQKLNASSKIAIGESNQYALTVLSKAGKIRKTKAQITHHTDEITPKTASGFGMYPDLNHR